MKGLTRKLTSFIIVFLLTIIGVLNINLSAASTGAPSFRGGLSLDAGGYILEVDDYGVDENEDSSYDTLALSMKLNFSSSGSYQIYATMSPSDIPANSHIIDDFSAGIHDVILSLDGVKIFNSARDGKYKIAISIYSDQEWLTEYVYTTNEYSNEDFNPTPTSTLLETASIEVTNNTITLKTNIFTAEIHERTPLIIFYYSTDDGLTAKFKVSYHRIIGFDDINDDEEFQENEIQFYGDLINSEWDSIKVLMENYNSFDFRVQTIVDLVDTTRAEIGTKLQLTFRYSSATKFATPSAAQKFDISIKVLGGDSLEGVTHLAIEHTLEDLTENHEFSENKEENKISFMTHDNKEHGYYQWKDKVEVESELGVRLNKKVTYNLIPTIENTVMKLFINYQYSEEYVKFTHDPVVGVNPMNQPSLPSPPKPPIIRHEIWIYLIVAIIAGMVMFGSIYRQRKKR